MRLLLDENLPPGLRPLLVGLDVFTVAFTGWAGVPNGELPRRACAARSDAPLSLDSGLADQHNTEGLPVAVLVVRARSGAMEDLEPWVPGILAAVRRLKPGSVQIVDPNRPGSWVRG
jgi:predicted nuclease of predicted toxin-antitoxin system